MEHSGNRADLLKHVHAMTTAKIVAGILVPIRRPVILLSEILVLGVTATIAFRDTDDIKVMLGLSLGVFAVCVVNVRRTIQHLKERRRVYSAYMDSTDPIRIPPATSEIEMSNLTIRGYALPMAMSIGLTGLMLGIGMILKTDARLDPKSAFLVLGGSVILLIGWRRIDVERTSLLSPHVKILDRMAEKIDHYIHDRRSRKKEGTK